VRRDERAEVHRKLEEVKKTAQKAQKSSDVERELRCIKYELKKSKSRVSAEPEEAEVVQNRKAN
jgi:hypothetical protein